MPSSGFRESSWFEMNTTGSPRYRANRSSAYKSCGSSVDPGTSLSKAQLEARRDSIIDSQGLDGQLDTKTARDSFAELARKMRLDNPQLDMFTLEGNPYTSDDFVRGRRPGNLRTLITFVILFLIVFGSIYTLVEYLLFNTRASASCAPSTVYIPVTRYASASAAAPSIDNSTTRLKIYSTATAVETITSYVTMQPAVVATGLTSSGGPSYYFTVNSAGSTDWLNGISPPATASLTVITRSVFVTPVMPTMPTDSLSTTTATITLTATIQQTITMPASTSTAYSYVEPDTTVTSTSTHYVTYTVSNIPSTGPSAEATGPRASYSGPGMSGWNSSSSNAPGPTVIAAAAEAEPQLTTMTEIHYFGDGEKTTSTMTNLITTIVQVAYTTILSPAVPKPSDSPEVVTTVTALPVTISYSGDDGYSTSIAFNTSAVSPFASSSRINSTSPYQTGASIASPLGSSGTSAATAASQSLSSGIFANSTSAATVSAANYSPSVSPLSSLSSSAVATNESTAGPVTGRSSVSGSMSSGSITTAPGPVSTSTSMVQTSSTSTLNRQSPTTSASTALPPSSSASSPSGLSTLPSNTNATVVGASTMSISNSAATVSSAPSLSTSGAPNMPPPAYGSYTAQSSANSSVSAEPANSSPESFSSGAPATSSSKSFSVPTISNPVPSQTWSTSVRSSSISRPAASSLPSVSLATASPNTTLSSSPASSATSQSSSTSSSGSTSVLSYSQTFVPSTTISMTGVPASAASSMPTTGCGEYGDFMLNFDNLPDFTPSSQNQTDITQAPPIQNPYHHFAFSDGYVYAPNPRVPYEPISQPHLAVFLGNGTGMRASQAGHTIEDGAFADGPYEASSAFWFDVFGAWLGCDNEGPEVCTLVMSAYTYSAKEKDEVPSFTQNATVEGCPGFEDCKLKKVEFPNTFKGLSGLQIQAFVGQEERMFFMDDIAMRWTDNSCAAGLTRQRAR